MTRLGRFIEEMEKILQELVSSLSCVTLLLHTFSEKCCRKTLGENRASLDGNCVVLDELYQTQCQAKETLSDLQHILKQWTPCSDDERAQQDNKLKNVLQSFERAAKDSANEAIASRVASFRLVSAFRLSLSGLLV